MTRLLRGGMGLGGLIMYLRAVLLNEISAGVGGVSCPPSPVVSLDGTTFGSSSASAGMSSKSATSTASRSLSPTVDSGITPVDIVYLLMQLVRCVPCHLFCCQKANPPLTAPRLTFVLSLLHPTSQQNYFLLRAL